LKKRYTFHAMERMRQRGICREEVEACLDDPSRIIEDKESKRVKKLNDKALIVVYGMEADAITVITAYYTSKLYKYL